MALRLQLHPVLVSVVAASCFSDYFCLARTSNNYMLSKLVTDDEDLSDDTVYPDG